MDIRTALPTAVSIGALLGLTAAAFDVPTPTQANLVAAATLPVAEIVQWDLPIVRNEYVQRFVDLFEQKQTDRMALYLKRSGRYEGMILSKLRERGMPEDLLYLSMIESGFNPNARSKSEAVGLWQFIAGTGRRYGLRIDGYVDERRDPEKSTDAALAYLQDLYDQFGSWNLAAAAYNSGENRIARIMREETGGVRGVESDFWRIRSRLPSETREYVPLIFAAAIIGKEPQKYGLEGVERLLPIETERVLVPPGTSLGVVARAIGVPLEGLGALNAHLLKGSTPPGGEPYPVVIPRGRSDAYAMNFAAAQAEAVAAAAAARVADAAKAAATRSAATRTVAAQRPAPAASSSRATTPSRPPARAASAARTHRVARGESLWTIARRHGVTVAAIQRANNMGKRTVIQPGQVLRIPA